MKALSNEWLLVHVAKVTEAEGLTLGCQNERSAGDH